MLITAVRISRGSLINIHSILRAYVSRIYMHIFTLAAARLASADLALHVASLFRPFDRALRLSAQAF